MDETLKKRIVFFVCTAVFTNGRKLTMQVGETLKERIVLSYVRSAVPHKLSVKAWLSLPSQDMVLQQVELVRRAF